MVQSFLPMHIKTKKQQCVVFKSIMHFYYARVSAQVHYFIVTNTNNMLHVNFESFFLIFQTYPLLNEFSQDPALINVRYLGNI